MGRYTQQLSRTNTLLNDKNLKLEQEVRDLKIAIMSCCSDEHILSDHHQLTDDDFIKLFISRYGGKS